MTKLGKVTHHLLVCAHKHCLKRGGRETGRELKRALKDADKRGNVKLTAVDCLDQCDDGPIVVVYPEGVWYGAVEVDDAREIVEQLMSGGRCVERNVLHVLPAAAPVKKKS